MGKNKKEQQKRRETLANCPSLGVYDFSKLPGEAFGKQLDVLFHSEKWVETMQHRNRMLKTCNQPGANIATLYEGLKRDDRKIADMLLQHMYVFYRHLNDIQNSRSLTLAEYFSDFVKTDEQKELYNDFKGHIDYAIFLADMVQGALSDAESKLRELDPTCILNEFDGIKRALSSIRDFASLKHKEMHQELLDLWCECSDDIEQVMYLKYKEYCKNYEATLTDLIARGEVDPKTHTITKNSY